jgi:hypothetical protein
MHVIVWTPVPGREYGDPEVTGPFASGEDALDYLDHAEVTDGWNATVVEVDLAPPHDEKGRA